MRTIVAILFMLVLAPLCFGQGEKAKLDKLTPKEIADGWILLFDGETTFGWDISGQATVAEGWLIIGGKKEQSTAVCRAAFPGTYRISFEAARIGMSNAQPLQLIASTNGKRVAATLIALDRRPKQYNELSPTASDSDVNRVQIVVPAGETVSIRNIKLQPTSTKSLFNGKDLDGWRGFPGDKYKSKFTVKDGAINVKDGPGDLQTVGKFKDFVLQFECISNGKHLNSGIFFRCRDNEYQNGYEAQIRNQFTEKPTQKYLIEEFDPKTNKLLGKNEFMSTAFDYGTGAIYRRVPARKEMSKDNEWFGMTILAHGNHLATWVNGVQVTDWTDNRPKTDNARTGCKLDAGHLSIQGHDPTTDLSFKNFRIAEFK
jgi:hypothetical protein